MSRKSQCPGTSAQLALLRSNGKALVAQVGDECVPSTYLPSLAQRP